MNKADFIAAQRTDHGVPHAVSCRALGVAESTFHEQRSRQPTPTQQRRAGLDTKAKACFVASGGTYGSPRVHAQLRCEGVAVSRKTVFSTCPVTPFWLALIPLDNDAAEAHFFSVNNAPKEHRDAPPSPNPTASRNP